MRQQKKSEDPKGNPAPALKILIVDDIMENRYLLESMFGANGYVTESASNGIEALEHLKRQQFDAIISDLLMPKMDGFQLIRECKKDPSLNKIPFIIYTATYTDTKDVEFGLSLGAVRYIIKPAEPEVLLHELNETLRQSKEWLVEEPVRTIKDNENFNREYAQRLVKKLDKKILLLQESEERFRNIFIHAAEGILIADISMQKFLYANPAICKMLGYSAQELTSMEMRDINPEKDLAHVQEEFMAQARGEKTLAESIPVLRKDGAVRYMDIRTTPVIIDGHRCNLGMFTDITERRQVDEALRIVNEKYTKAFLSAPDAITISELDSGRFVEVNDAATRIFGYSRDELIGKTAVELGIWLNKDDRDRFIDQVRKHGKVSQFEVVERHKSGELFYARVNADTISIGNITYLIAIISNITERKRAETALQESEGRFKELFNNMSAGVAIYEVVDDGEDFIFRDINRAVETIEHVMKDEVIGHRVLDIFPGVKEFGLFDVFRRVVKTGIAEHHPVSMYKDNRIAGWRENYIYKLPSGDIVALYEDVTEKKQVEEELKINLTKYKVLFESFPLAITMTDKTGNIVESNRQAENLLGLSLEEQSKRMIDGTEWHLIRTDGTPMPADEYASVRALKENRLIQNIEMGVIKGNSAVTWINVTAAPIPLKDYGVAITYSDITKRKQAEAALITSETRYRRFFEAVRDGILILDAKTGMIVDVNPFMTELLGFSHERFLGKKIWEIGIFRHIADNKDKFEDLQRKGYIRYEDLPLETADGRQINVEFISFVYKVDDKEVIQCNIRDITERKQAENALRESEERFRELADSITDVFFAMNKDLRYTYWNKASEDLTGVPAQDAIGKSIFQIFPDTPETRRAVEVYQDVLKTEQPRSFENEYNRGGKRFYFDISVYPTADGFAVISTDITERKRVEEALRQSEERYRRVFENTGTATVVLDESTIISLANAEFAQLAGFSKEDIEGKKSWTEFVFREDLEQMLAQNLLRMQNSKKAITHYEFRFVTKSGDIRNIYLTVDVIPGTKKSIASLLDITERKLAEEMLKESEERYRNVVEGQTEFICRFLPDGTHVFVNDAYCRYFGKKREEILGHRFKVTIHPEDREQVARLFSSLSPQEPLVWIVQRIIMPEGNIRWQRWSDRAIFDKNGRIIEYQSVGRDITEQKQAEEELQKLTRELEQRVKDRTDALMHLNEEMLEEISQRKDVEHQLQLSVSEKETLLKEIHHRVKNNLQIIASLLNLQSQFIKDEQTLSVIKDSQNRIKTMALIHEKIYQSKSLDRIDYGDYLEKITRSLFESYGISPKKIVMKIHAKDIVLHIDKAIPCSLIINELLANSFKHAFPKDRTGEVRIDVQLDGDTIRLLYSDNGVGLPESVTLDRTESLGMRLIAGLTQQLKGTVEIQRGGGTTFLIAFNV